MSTRDERLVWRQRKGVTARALTVIIDDPTLNLTGATVKFRMRSVLDGSLKVNDKPAVVLVATVTPTVSYNWEDEDVDTEGEYEGFFWIENSDLTFDAAPDPQEVYIIIGDNYK